MLNTEIINIRGHHLVHLISKKSRAEVSRQYIDANYVDSDSDPFIDEITNFPKLIKNPLTRFKITADEADYLCQRCPVWARSKGRGCIGSLHYQADKYIAESYGFELGRIYTSSQLIEIINRKNRNI